MSRTFHTRPRRTRIDPTIAAKKPDEGRRWARRNVLRGTLPLRDARRIDRIDHANDDADRADTADDTDTLTKDT